MYKSLNMNLVSIKKHESILYKNEPTFLFSGEVIPITNQRTDSHPASDSPPPICLNKSWTGINVFQKTWENQIRYVDWYVARK